MTFEIDDTAPGVGWFPTCSGRGWGGELCWEAKGWVLVTFVRQRFPRGQTFVTQRTADERERSGRLDNMTEKSSHYVTQGSHPPSSNRGLERSGTGR